MAKRTFAESERSDTELLDFSRLEELAAELVDGLGAPAGLYAEARFNCTRAKRVAVQIERVQELLQPVKEELVRIAAQSDAPALEARLATGSAGIGINEWGALPVETLTHVLRFCRRCISLRLVCKLWAQIYTSEHVRHLRLPNAGLFAMIKAHTLPGKFGPPTFYIVDSEHEKQMLAGLTDCVQLHPDTAITLCVSKLKGGAAATQVQVHYYMRLLEKRGARHCASLTLVPVAPVLHGTAKEKRPLDVGEVPLPRTLIIDCNIDGLSAFSALVGVEHLVITINTIFPLLSSLDYVQFTGLKSIEFRLRSGLTTAPKDTYVWDYRELMQAHRVQKIMLRAPIDALVQHYHIDLRAHFGDVPCVNC